MKVLFAMVDPQLPDVTAVHQSFTRFAVAKLRQQCERIVESIERLDDERLWLRANEHSNSIGNLVLHLSGNVRQWVSCGIAGLPDDRDRDAEFDARGGKTGQELAALITERVAEVCRIIESLPPHRLLDPLENQGYQTNVLETIFHVTEHFLYHSGQILLLTKIYLDVDLGYYAHLNRSNKIHTATTP